MFYLVFFAQIVLIGLTVLLIARMYSLVKENNFPMSHAETSRVLLDENSPDQVYRTPVEKKERKTSTDRQVANARVDSLAKSQIFSASQLLVMKQQGFDGKSKDRGNWLNKAVACYLMGASTKISSHFQCTDSDTEDVIMFILTRNLDLSYEAALGYLTPEFLNSGGEYRKALFQSGKEAADNWLREKKVPADLLITSAISEWGLVA